MRVVHITPQWLFSSGIILYVERARPALSVDAKNRKKFLLLKVCGFWVNRHLKISKLFKQFFIYLMEDKLS